MESFSPTTELYRPLDSNRQEIRLLEVEEAISSSGISCRLSTISLDDHPQFTALSYVWGDPTVTQKIRVNGHVIYATINLAGALQFVKSHWSRAFPDRNPFTFRLWADAICINQADLKERSEQVQLMERIYTDADFVFSWMCDEDAEIMLAFESIRTVSMPILQSANLEQESHRILDWIRQRPTLYEADCGNFNEFRGANKVWNSVASFLGLPYWKRVWIFQEVTLARKCILAAGNASLEWAELEAVSRFVGSLNRQYHLGQITKPDWMCFSAWHAITSNRHHNWEQVMNLSTARSLVYKRVDYVFQIQRWISAIDNTLQLEATNPKDHVYALLSLSQPLLAVVPITPDYSDHKSVGSVYVDFISAWLETIRRKDADGVWVKWTQELYFLMSAGDGIGDRRASVPSWVPDFSARPSDSHELARVSRNTSLFNFDTEVAGVSDNSLFAVGLKLGSISDVSEELMELSHPDEGSGLFRYVEQFCIRHPTYVTGMPGLQAIMRVLSTAEPSTSHEEALDLAMMALWGFFGDRPAQRMHHREKLKRLGLNPESETALQSSLQAKFLPNFGRVLGGKVFLNRVVGQGNEKMDSSTVDKMQEHLIHLVKSGKRRIVELDTNYIGLGPGGTRVGDLVCVLKGCPMPVVLRQVKDYQVHIGTCYILDLESEAGKKYMEQCAVNLELFELR